MKMRYPAVPLITNDPYFSIWSFSDQLNADDTRHWTGRIQPIRGTITNSSHKEYTFMGWSRKNKLKQIDCTVTATSTVYIFDNLGSELEVEFLSPLLLDDLKLASSPVTFMKITQHDISQDLTVRLNITDEIVLDNKENNIMTVSCTGTAKNLAYARMGNLEQNYLNRSGDDLRIDWGYFYLAGDKNLWKIAGTTENGSSNINAEVTLTKKNNSAVIMFAYDDIYSIQYFHKNLKSYWAKDGENILNLMTEISNNYPNIKARCAEFDRNLWNSAVKTGGKKYAELLSLAYRQSIAAHKMAADNNGDLLFISKECYSNGCAATVDVSYPSIPLYLLFNPELVKGMMRPIFRYARSEEWPYDFAPHDAGRYPIVNGQRYGGGTDINYQMPVEECGNMLIMAAACFKFGKDIEFVKENMDLYDSWVKYLVKYGADPGIQLCTDDFAGHLAHNCNLALKSIMGIASYALLCRALDDEDKYAEYTEIAIKMAGKFKETASESDGTYRLAFDRKNTFSLKYNAVWDKIFGTHIFEDGMFDKECCSYIENHMNKYGIPLDNRSDYTKSDWLMWIAALTDRRDISDKIIDSLWQFYNDTPDRVPMGDWYDTIVPRNIEFRNRTVQGGLFIKLLLD